MNRTPSSSPLMHNFMARVQTMCKWVAGHAVQITGTGPLTVTVGDDVFEVDPVTFPDDVTVARCALAIAAQGVGNFDVGDFDEETLYRFFPPSAADNLSRSMTWSVVRASEGVETSWLR